MPVIPVIAAVGSAAVAAAPAISAVGGIYSTVKGMQAAKKASSAAGQQAGQTAAGQVGPGSPIQDTEALDAQARKFSAKNAEEGAAMREKYNPGVTKLQNDSLAGVMGAMNEGALPIGQRNTQWDQGPTVDPRTGQMLDKIVDQAGNPLTNDKYDSALTRDAVAKAKADLALGGQLNQDVRNLVARKGLAKAGSVTGNLGLGRDIGLRDLGLTSRDVENERLQNAFKGGAAEADLEKGNALLRFDAEKFGRQNLLDSNQQLAQAQRDADARFNATASRSDSNYYRDEELKRAIQSGNFDRYISAHNLAQNIAAPKTGLDPGTVASLAAGNTALSAEALQQQQAIDVARGNETMAAGSGGLGAALPGIVNGIGTVAGLFNKKTPAPIYKPLTPISTGFTAPPINYGMAPTNYSIPKANSAWSFKTPAPSYSAFA